MSNEQSDDKSSLSKRLRDEASISNGMAYLQNLLLEAADAVETTPSARAGWEKVPVGANPNFRFARPGEQVMCVDRDSQRWLFTLPELGGDIERGVK